MMLLLADRYPALKSASFTGIIAAVWSFFAVQGMMVFLFQKGGGYAGINMSPGQQFIQRALSVGIEVGVKSGIFEGVKPVLIMKALIPGIEGAAQLPGAINNLAQSSVSP